MDRGGDSWETPFITGNEFSQRMQKYIILITIVLCWQFNGKSHATARHLSFAVRMQRSISATCYFAAEVLTTVFPINSSLVESNSTPIKIVWTIILPRPYNFITLFIFLLSCLSVRELMYSTVINLIPRDTVTKKDILFTNITSATRDTNLCNAKNTWE